MRTQNMNPKLLFEFYRGQKVPPLTTKYEKPRNEIKSPFNNRRSSSNHSMSSLHSRKTNEKKFPTKNLQKINQSLQKQAQENQELRLIIQQLTQKSDLLQEVNERLINRINQLEAQLKSQTEVYDLEKRSVENRIKGNVYTEIQEFLRSSIEKFMVSLRKEKMSPIVQNKIQGFLEQIININQLSVEKYSRVHSNKKNQSQASKEEVNTALKEILYEREKQKMSASKRMSASKKNRDYSQQKSNKYRTIFEKLNNTSPREQEYGYQETQRTEDQRRKRSPSFMDVEIESSPMRSRMRPKIFNQKYATETKNRSMRTEWE